jgi:hypothetical protein
VDYIRLVTRLPEHPKWIETPAPAVKVLIQLWCYCGRNETDGHIPATVARREGLTPALARRLEELGWIHRNGSGWHVHDWTDHQPTVEQIAQKREKARQRVSKWREAHGL